MINSDFGTVTVHGARPIILAELTTLLGVLRDGGVSDAEIVAKTLREMKEE